MNIINWIKGAFSWQQLEEEIEILSADLNNSKIEIAVLKGMFESENIKPPKMLSVISNSELRGLLSKYCKSEDIKLSDRNYGLTSIYEAKKYSISTKVYINKWKSEEYDCDEFSFALMGYWNLDLKQFAFGIAWSNSHAFNIMIDNNKDVYIIEPQTNKFILIEDAMKMSKYYPFNFIII